MGDLGDHAPELILMASGSEVALIEQAAVSLAGEGIGVRLVSFPSWELFESQDIEYRNSVLLPSVKARLAVEAGVSQGWERWVGDAGDILSIEKYGASAPYQIIYKNYGFTIENVMALARALLGK
jgi:transketolase